jgi:hypothetical protein
VNKTLSENRQIEQHVGAGKLNEGQPVFGLLGPASAQAATLEEPGNRPLHHPSSRRMRLPRRVLSLRGFAARFGGLFLSGIDLDVGRVARRGGEFPYI